jgi:uncharacterized protein (TIGR02246 family)
MKDLIMFLLVVAFIALNSCAKQVDIEAEKTNVQSVLSRYVKAWETLDAEMYLKNFAHDTDMVIFSSIPTVSYVGWETFKEVVQEGFGKYGNTKVSFSDERVKVHPSGNVAWLSCYFDFDFVSEGQPTSVKGIRTTWILEKRNGNWVIVHAHWSLPQGT